MVCSRKSFSMGRRRTCYPSTARTAIMQPHGRTALLPTVLFRGVHLRCNRAITQFALWCCCAAQSRCP
jgi:hypothetical protein